MLTVAQALAHHVRGWYIANYGSELTASQEKEIAFYSSGTDARVARLFGSHLADLDRRPPEAVVDLGCGYGAFAIHLAARWPTTRIVATDVSDRFFLVGRAAAQDLRLQNVSFRAQRVEELEDAEVYDLVISCNMLNFMNSRELLQEALFRLWRSAKPGGLILVHTPHYWSLREPFTGLPGLQLLPIYYQDYIARRTGKRSLMTDNRHPSFGEIRRAMVRHGAALLEARPTEPWRRLLTRHITVWFQKL